jgi:plasmid stability protein
MATLYVENVPDDLYGALRTRARQRRRSIAAELIAVLQETIPTREELKARRAFLRKMKKLSSRKPLRRGPFPSAEEMVREDRAR